MRVELWEPSLPQSAMARRVAAELAREPPHGARIVWTYRSPWKDPRLAPLLADGAANASSPLLLNHVPAANLLTRKTLLPRFLRAEAMDALAPPTFLLPRERAAFAAARPRGEWVEKHPAHGGVRALPPQAAAPTTPRIVQRRLAPCRLNGSHHFDVGVYALLDAEGRGLLYDEVLVRLVGREALAVGRDYLPAWAPRSPLAPWMRGCDHSAGCALARALAAGGAPPRLLARMREHARDVLHALVPHARRATAQLARRRGGTSLGLRHFELLRFDFAVDRAWRVWLLEVNASPSTVGVHPHDARVKHALLRDALRTVAGGAPAGRWRVVTPS